MRNPFKKQPAPRHSADLDRVKEIHNTLDQVHDRLEKVLERLRKASAEPFRLKLVKR